MESEVTDLVNEAAGKQSENSDIGTESTVNADENEKAVQDNAESEDAKENSDDDGREEFRQAVLRMKQERAGKAEGIVRLAARLCGTDENDLDSIESAVMQRQAEWKQKNDMRFRLDEWRAEGEAVKEMYPEFDLDAEMKNRDFFSLCYKGIGLADAYLIVHKDEIICAAMEYAASELMKSGAVKADGKRAREGVLSVSNAPENSKKLSKSERKELIRRTERGERVVL